jgi:hypothetical protein
MSYFHFKPVHDETFEKSFLVIFLAFSIGIFTVALILWNRLIRLRLPRELFTLEDCSNSMRFWIVLELALIFWIFTFLTLWALIKKLRQKDSAHPLIFLILRFQKYLRSNRRYVMISNFSNDYISNAPKFIWIFFLKQSQKWTRFVGRILVAQGCLYIKRLYHPYICRESYMKKLEFTLILFAYLPRALLGVILLCEVIINRKIELFYALLPLLIIPTLFWAILKAVDHTSYFDMMYIKRELKDLNVLWYNERDVDIDYIKNGLKDEQYPIVFHCSKDEYLTDRAKDWFIEGKELPGVLAIRDSMNSMKWLLLNDAPKNVLHCKEVNNLITLYYQIYEGDRFANKLETFHEYCEAYAKDYAQKANKEESLETKAIINKYYKKYIFKSYLYKYLCPLVTRSLYALSYSFWVLIYIGMY